MHLLLLSFTIKKRITHCTTILRKKIILYFVHHLLLNNELISFKNLRVFVIDLDIKLRGDRTTSGFCAS
jgi:hypothetical protein